MTGERRLALLTAKATKHAKVHARSKASATKALVKEGLYTTIGSLSPNYGGEPRKPAIKRA